MALVALGFSRCALCGSTIEEGDEVIASDAVSAYGRVDLSAYCDTPLHRRCFDVWEHRDEFLRQAREAGLPLD